MVKTILFYAENQAKCYFLAVFFFLLSIQKSTAATYYINDNDIKGDIYTSTVGNDSNDGTSSSSPKLSIQSTYNKAQDGDTIFIDTGNYFELSENGKLLFTVTKKITFIIAGTSDSVFSKNPLPSNIKVNPKEIYLDKDKPIEREAYLQQLRNKKTKKSQ